MRQMNGGDFRKAFGFVAVGLMGLGASAIDITEDTTVTGADIAAYATGDINIADGKTLTLSNPDKSYTFTGALSGSGNFVIKSGSASWNRMTLNGNASSFTGGIYLTNHLFTVSSPAALGAAKTFVASGSQSDWNLFEGGGAYPTDMHLNVGLVSLYRQTTDLQGAIKLKAGAKVRGPGCFSGSVNCAGWLYAYNNICFAGPVTLTGGGKLSCGSESLTLAYKLTCEQYYENSTINFAADEVFAGATVITTGTVSLNLNGHNQTWNGSCYQNSATIKVATAVDKPAKFSIRGVLYSSYKFNNFTGPVALYLYPDKTTNTKFSFTGTQNTTTGIVQVAYGYVTLANGVSFNERCTFDFKPSSSYDAHLILPKDATATIKGLIDLGDKNKNSNFASKKKIEAGEGGVLIVDEVSVNGKMMKAGDYKSGDGSELGTRITGAGTVRVLGKPGLIISFR